MRGAASIAAKGGGTATGTTEDPHDARSDTTADPLAAYVEIAFHSDLRRVGAHALAATIHDRDAARQDTGDEERLTIGRDHPRFSKGGHDDGPLADPCVSRRQLTVRYDIESRSFDVRADAAAKRAIRAFDDSGAERSLDRLPHGSFVAIGDRVLLRLDVAALSLLASHPAVAPLGGLLGDSAPMRRLREEIASVATIQDTILLLGETGVGKELAARAIHAASARRDGPFVAVNCAALPEALIESELFGHAAGSFSGAKSAALGLFRAANGGTLLLDEIAELPLTAQPKLLRVLQERAVRAVGETRERSVDVRVLCATHRDPAVEVAEGRLRSDLYARIEAPRIVVPPLRSRRQDIPRLFAAFLIAQPSSPLVRDVSKAPPPVPLDHVLSLLRHSWPRNVRELQRHASAVNAASIERDVFRAPSDWSSSSHLDGAPASSATKLATVPAAERATRPSATELLALLEAHDYVQRRVAAALAVSRTTLDKWMRELGIGRPSDLSDAAIVDARAACDGDLDKMAAHLRVSVRGLKLRL